MTGNDTSVLSSFVTESGVTVLGLIKDRRLYVRGVVDGKKCHLPPLGPVDAEKLGTMQAKYLNMMRGIEKAEELL